MSIFVELLMEGEELTVNVMILQLPNLAEPSHILILLQIGRKHLRILMNNNLAI